MNTQLFTSSGRGTIKKTRENIHTKPEQTKKKVIKMVLWLKRDEMKNHTCVSSVLPFPTAP